jgi:hypothetical protein
MLMLKHIDGKIDLDCYFWDDLHELETKIVQSMENSGYCYFAIAFDDEENGTDGFGNSLPTDPLAVHLTTGMNDMLSDQEPTFAFSVRDIWEDFLDAHCEGGDIENKLSDESIPKAKMISNALRALADEIDCVTKRK